MGVIVNPEPVRGEAGLGEDGETLGEAKTPRFPRSCVILAAVANADEDAVVGVEVVIGVVVDDVVSGDAVDATTGVVVEFVEEEEVLVVIAFCTVSFLSLFTEFN